MTADPIGDSLILGAPGIEGKTTVAPSHQAVNAFTEEKNRLTASEGELDEKKVALEPEITAALPSYDGEERDDEDRIIVTGADAATYLLPMRDDGQPALTFRSIFLATILSAFQAVVYQIYQFKPTSTTIQGTFIVLVAYFLGVAWSRVLPRGDKFEARWRAGGGLGSAPLWIRIMSFFNHGDWNLKEHSITAITATSASIAAPSSQVFAAQNIFYDLPLKPITVIFSTMSIGLFGYGICGIIRPVCVWHVDAVYWSSLPTVKVIQGLHWQSIKDNKPIRWFWIAFTGMFCYEFFPAYIFPWLNSISIPCLAAMHATGNTAKTLTNLFGGSVNNEGLGLFSLSLDWQYITSFQTALPLKLQLHQTLGLGVCFIVMLAIYYGDVWGAKALPFMSTRLRTESGKNYPSAKVFVNGVLDKSALAKYGVPKLTGTFAYAMFMANAAIGALFAHIILFWGGDIVKTFKNTRKGKFDDPHHAHMHKHYKEAPWWWYMLVIVVSFILGLIVVVKENITLPVWAYIFALIMGSIIAPFSIMLYSRFGNGIATNNLSKIVAGLLIPGRPIGNMYFAAWSHNVVNGAVQLSMDLKLGEYLKIPPRVMFLTQIYGTVLGGFINYAVMISIVAGNRDLLANKDGDSSWSGANIQSYNTNASTWALASYLYKEGKTYAIVPFGLLIGAAFVAAHRIFYHFVPKIGKFSIDEINLPQFIQYAGYIPYNQSQTCVLFSWTIAGLYTQYYLRNYRPRIFRDYSYLIAGAFDGASLTCLFILSFAVFGAGGPAVPFPQWWGNNVAGYYDHCPIAQ
ncbi:hypothetical protein ACEQ8H_006890 [Pleosporales sp. CAS-2024a]